MMKNDRKNKADLELMIYFSQEPESMTIPDGIEAIVESAIKATLAYEGVERSCEVSVTFCDGAYIRSLNAEYRQKDSVTDVLSFPLFDEDEEDPIAGERLPLGDIVLNLDRAAEQAEELGHSTMREVAFLSIHSTLHLLGYDHERSEEDDEDMCRRQREIIAVMGEK